MPKNVFLNLIEKLFSRKLRKGTLFSAMLLSTKAVMLETINKIHYSDAFIMESLIDLVFAHQCSVSLSSFDFIFIVSS